MLFKVILMILDKSSGLTYDGSPVKHIRLDIMHTFQLMR